MVSVDKSIFRHDWMVWASLQALGDVVERPAGAFFPEKMTSLEILDMSFTIFVVFS